METITKNSLVSISLKIADAKKKLLDESEELIYLHGGYGQIFKKLEEELEGKKTGDSFSLSLTPAQAFGEYDDSLVLKESLDALPEDLTLGMELESEGEEIVWVVESIEDGFAILNANHEFAGVALHVWGEVLELESLSDEGVEEVLNMEHTH